MKNTKYYILTIEDDLGKQLYRFRVLTFDIEEELEEESLAPFFFKRLSTGRVNLKATLLRLINE